MRLFGWNVDLDGPSSRCGYQMAVVARSDQGVGPETEIRGLSPVDVPGGLYAVARVPAGDASSIVAVWNRLLAQWLPRSAFELGAHGCLEEYQLIRGRSVRMKLYLPVRRQERPETIEIADRPAIRAIVFRAAGADAAAKADEAAVEWLRHRGLAGDRRVRKEEKR